MTGPPGKRDPVVKNSTTLTSGNSNKEADRRRHPETVSSPLSQPAVKVSHRPYSSSQSAGKKPITIAGGGAPSPLKKPPSTTGGAHAPPLASGSGVGGKLAISPTKKPNFTAVGPSPLTAAATAAPVKYTQLPMKGDILRLRTVLPQGGQPASPAPAPKLNNSKIGRLDSSQSSAYPAKLVQPKSQESAPTPTPAPAPVPKSLQLKSKGSDLTSFSAASTLVEGKRKEDDEFDSEYDDDFSEEDELSDGEKGKKAVFEVVPFDPAVLAKITRNLQNFIDKLNVQVLSKDVINMYEKTEKIEEFRRNYGNGVKVSVTYLSEKERKMYKTRRPLRVTVHIHSLHMKGHVYEDNFDLFILGDDHWDLGMNAFAKKVVKELGRKGFLRENSYVKQLTARKNYFYGATKQTKGKS